MLWQVLWNHIWQQSQHIASCDQSQGSSQRAHGNMDAFPGPGFISMSPASRSCTIKMFLPVGDMGAGCLGLRIAPWTGFGNLARPSMSTSGSFLPEKVIAWCFQKLDWQAVCRWKYSCQVQICDRVRSSHSTPIRCEECVDLPSISSVSKMAAPRARQGHPPENF